VTYRLEIRLQVSGYTHQVSGLIWGQAFGVRCGVFS